MTKSNLLPYLEATFAATVWGASFIATKVALNDVSPITIVWLRFGMGLLVLGAAGAGLDMGDGFPTDEDGGVAEGLAVVDCSIGLAPLSW